MSENGFNLAEIEARARDPLTLGDTYRGAVKDVLVLIAELRARDSVIEEMRSVAPTLIQALNREEKLCSGHCNFNRCLARSARTLLTRLTQE